MREKRRIKGPKVNNKRVLRNIAKRTIRANKGKSLMTILSIALCTLMFTVLFTVGGNMIEKLGESNARQVGGNSDASLKYLTEKEYEAVASDSKLKEVTQRIIVGCALNKELAKLRTELTWCDEKSAHDGFCYPEVGRLPQKEEEIVVSNLVLQAFGMKAEEQKDYEDLIGEKITFMFEGKNGTCEQEFVISGIYTGDRVSMAQQAIVSKAYQQKAAPTPEYSYYSEASDGTVSDIYGRIDAGIDFYIPINVEGQLEQAIIRDGLPGNVEKGINWGSLGGTFDPFTLVLVVFLLLTFFFSGYLIISNVYRINVYTDIRSYGLLKTVGTSSLQLKKIVKYQAVYHAAYGIILGVISGLLVGGMVLPVVMKNLIVLQGIDAKMHLNAGILLFSALFSYVTVRISVGRAMRMASAVTPIEALKYTEKESVRMRKKAAGRFTPLGFASRNVFRERKRCFFVVLSLALSLVVLNSVYTLIIGFDENKYVESYVKTDFAVADATTDNPAAAENCYDGVTASFLDELQKLDGIREMGNVYAEEFSIQELNERDYERVKERLLENEKVDLWMRGEMSVNTSDGEMDMGKSTVAKIYGMDDYPITNLKIRSGVYDAEKFKTGKYIIVDEYDVEGGESFPYFLPGETIAVNNADGEVREYEVMATVEIPIAIRIQSYTDMDINYILPTEEFLDFYGERMPMRTLIDTTDESEEAVEQWMADYTGKVEPSLTYSSRAVYKKEFADFTGMFRIVGGFLTTVLALIGILNLINTLVTSVLSRRHELAMLEAVGMTGSVQRKSICLEGVLYGVMAFLAGGSLSSVFSLLLVNSIGSQIWFYRYHFTLLPVCGVFPIMIAVTFIISMIIYRRATKETVVERLRLTEA